MMNVIRPISDLRRPEEVNLRKDAAKRYGPPGREYPTGATTHQSAVVDLSGAVRHLGPGPSRHSESPGAEPRLVFNKPPPSREVLERAIQAFGVQQENGKQALQAPALPIAERPDQQVPLDVLQRVAAAQDTERDDESSGTPLGSRSADAQAKDPGAADAVPPKQTVFTVPDTPGEPFGRDVPFDLTELDTDVEAAAGAERSTLEVRSERTQAAENTSGAIAASEAEAPFDAAPPENPVAPNYEHVPAREGSALSAERQAHAADALSRARSQLATERYLAAPKPDSSPVLLQTELSSDNALVPGFELAV